MLLLRKVKFYERIWRSNELLNDIFTVYLLNNCSYDECLQSVFVPLYVETRNVYDSVYVSGGQLHV